MSGGHDEATTEARTADDPATDEGTGGPSAQSRGTDTSEPLAPRPTPRRAAFIDDDGQPVGLAVYASDAENKAYRRGVADGMAILKAEQARFDASGASSETAGLDVERRARALRQDGVLEGWDWNDQQPEGWRHRQLAEHVAAEYARLAKEDGHG